MKVSVPELYTMQTKAVVHSTMQGFPEEIGGVPFLRYVWVSSPYLMETTVPNLATANFWVTVKELKLSYHNGYI